MILSKFTHRSWTQFLPFYVLFFATGIATVLDANLLPILTTSPDGADLRLATALAVQFGGQLLGPLMPWRKPSVALTVGCALTAVSALLMMMVEGRGFYPVLACYGFGLGITMASTNVLVGIESDAALRTSRMELLNIFWPLGAAFCSPLLMVLPLSHTGSLAYALVAGVFLLAMLFFLCRRAAPTFDVEPQGKSRLRAGVRLLFVALLALLAIGIESGLASWLPMFNQRYLASNKLLPLSTVFWVGSITGRLAAAYFLHGKKTPTWMVRLCVLAYGLFLAMLLLLPATVPIVVFCSFMASAAVAPVYPALLTEAVTMRGNGLIFCAGGFGSALLPWLVGVFSARYHSLRGGMSLLFAGAVLMFCGAYLEQSRRRSFSAEENS
ncbi:MAG: hypothetical protein PW788_05760 [Micavibrio sp.]|nr:hypothetical protein [Micavibrio sp.]